jgi:hypothetical protein
MSQCSSCYATGATLRENSGDISAANRSDLDQATNRDTAVSLDDIFRLMGKKPKTPARCGCLSMWHVQRSDLESENTCPAVSVLRAKERNVEQGAKVGGHCQ